MSDDLIVELTIPALLAFRDLAVRVVMESCKLVGQKGTQQDIEKGLKKSTASGDQTGTGDESMPDARFELSDTFMAEFVSAFSEIYNNIPIHAYQGMEGGELELKIHIGEDHISASIIDTGRSFDIESVPLPNELPTGGMGIHIARSMVDELAYEPGPPNRWKLTKYIRSSPSSSDPP